MTSEKPTLATPWINTDDDSVQYRREATELECGQNKVFELYQVQAVKDILEVPDDDPAIYAIAHDYVYLSDIDVKSVLDSYGYDSMDEMIAEYGNAEKDGILAECQFELDAGCMENLARRMPLMTWSQAKETIEKLVGVA